jgi:hypothetical protein
MDELRCPECDAPIRARRHDPWEVIRSIAASHLRRCPKGSKDRRKIGLMAISIADNAIYAGPAT